jgi:hypothetical protein
VRRRKGKVAVLKVNRGAGEAKEGWPGTFRERLGVCLLQMPALSVVTGTRNIACTVCRRRCGHGPAAVGVVWPAGPATGVVCQGCARACCESAHLLGAPLVRSQTNLCGEEARVQQGKPHLGGGVKGT